MEDSGPAGQTTRGERHEGRAPGQRPPRAHDPLLSLDRDDLAGLVHDFIKNWLAHDGVWFQACEQEMGLETAVRLDGMAWHRFSPIEARRIMRRHHIRAGSGLDGLAQALPWRMYHLLNRHEITRDREALLLKLKECRVQEARARRGLPDFACKGVAMLDYPAFAHTIDPRIETTCLACPPDPGERDFWCGFRFELLEADRCEP